MDNESEIKKENILFKKLKDEWSLFVSIFFSPVIMLLMISIIFLFFIPSSDKDSESYKSLITLLISLFSGLAGALITSKWAKYQETGVLATRGKSAVRGLKLLLFNISTFEERLREQKKAIIDEDDGVQSLLFDESLERCSSLKEETLNSIEEWVGIVPDADVQIKIGELSNLEKARSILENKIVNLNKHIEEIKDESSKEKDNLRSKLKKSEEKLKSVKSRIYDSEKYIDPSYFSSTSGLYDAAANIYSTNNKKCDKCGMSYSGGLIDTGCPYCHGTGLHTFKTKT